MLTRGLEKNKATLSDSRNKGDLRGLKLAANEHISSFMLSCLARTATVEDARNLRVEFTQEHFPALPFSSLFQRQPSNLDFYFLPNKWIIRC